jgi:hypothetical protein
MKKIFILIAALGTISLSAMAQSPQKMSYQAVIRNASNNLVTNTAVGSKVSILQGSATGTVVYEETHTGTTNANGLLTFEVGAGTVVTGSFAAINWANGPYFIKTETDPNGGTNYTIAGTSELMSVPYALFSANGTPGPQGPAGATGAQGDPGATGAQGPQGDPGATGPQGPQGDPGATGAQGPAGTNGTNGTNGATGATGATGAQGPAGTNGTNGTNGATGATGAQGPAGTNGTNGTNGATGATGATGLLANGAAAGNTPYWNGTAWVVNSSNVFNNGANVGVGSTAPAAKLHVVGATNTVATPSTWTPAMVIDNAAGSSQLGIEMRVAGTRRGTIRSDAFDNLVLSSNGGALFLNADAPATSVIAFNNGATERARLHSNGNFGIGTTAPTNNLHVATTTLGGGITISGLTPGLSLNSNGALGAVNVANEWATGSVQNDIVLRNNNATAGLKFATGSSNTTRMAITATGNIGIGTTAPVSRFQIGNNMAGGALDNFNKYQVLIHENANAVNSYGMGIRAGEFVFNSDGHYSFETDGVTTVRFQDNGNVGIGTTAPTTKLHVVNAGSPAVRIVDGTQALGRVLTSDANGNASWAAANATTWGTTGNGSTSATTNFIGTTDANAFVTRTNNVERMRVSATGDVGIGTNNPLYKLHVEGPDIRMTNTGGGFQLKYFNSTQPVADQTIQVSVGGWGTVVLANIHTNCSNTTFGALFMVANNGTVQIMSQGSTNGGSLSATGNVITMTTPCGVTFTYTVTVNSGVATFTPSGSTGGWFLQSRMVSLYH